MAKGDFSQEVIPCLALLEEIGRKKEGLICLGKLAWYIALRQGFYITYR